MKTIFCMPTASRFFISLFVLASVSFAGCKKETTTTTPGINEVWIQNTAFTPASVSIAKNTTITWTNKDGIAHTVTSATGLFDSGNLAAGATYAHQFTDTGTFAYHCTFHSTMNGTVVVH